MLFTMEENDIRLGAILCYRMDNQDVPGEFIIAKTTCLDNAIGIANGDWWFTVDIHSGYASNPMEFSVFLAWINEQMLIPKSLYKLLMAGIYS